MSLVVFFFYSFSNSVHSNADAIYEKRQKQLSCRWVHIDPTLLLLVLLHCFVTIEMIENNPAVKQHKSQEKNKSNSKLFPHSHTHKLHVYSINIWTFSHLMMIIRIDMMLSISVRCIINFHWVFRSLLMLIHRARFFFQLLLLSECMRM